MKIHRDAQVSVANKNKLSTVTTLTKKNVKMKKTHKKVTRKKNDKMTQHEKNASVKKSASSTTADNFPHPQRPHQKSNGEGTDRKKKRRNEQTFVISEWCGARQAKNNCNSRKVFETPDKYHRTYTL